MNNPTEFKLIALNGGNHGPFAEAHRSLTDALAAAREYLGWEDMTAERSSDGDTWYLYETAELAAADGEGTSAHYLIERRDGR